MVELDTSRVPELVSVPPNIVELSSSIDPLLNADILYILRAMGHGDELVIVDANFPLESSAKQYVRADGVDLEKLTLWAMEVGWETLINRGSTTWRGLPDVIRENLRAWLSSSVDRLPPISKNAVIAGLSRFPCPVAPPTAFTLGDSLGSSA